MLFEHVRFAMRQQLLTESALVIVIVDDQYVDNVLLTDSEADHLVFDQLNRQYRFSRFATMY